MTPRAPRVGTLRDGLRRYFEDYGAEHEAFIASGLDKAAGIVQDEATEADRG